MPLLPRPSAPPLLRSSAPPHLRTLAPLLLILLLAFAVRTAGLAAPPLNGDEAFTVLFAERGWSEMLTAMRATEPNPPLHFFGLKAWMMVAGHSEFSVRFLSVWFGVLAVPLTYVLGRRLLGRRIGLAAALLAAVNPYLVWYSHFARAYSLYLTLTLASLVLALPLLRARKVSRQIRLAYVGVTALALYTHYYAYLFLGAQNLIFLLFFWTSRRPQSSIHNSQFSIHNSPFLGSWLTAQTAVAVLTAPWLLLTAPMLIGHEKAWLTYVSPAAGLWRTLKAYSLGVDVQGWFVLPLALLFAGLLCAGVAALWRRNRQALIVSGTYLFAPLAIVLLGSLWRPIFLERYLIGVVPALLVLVAAGIVGIAGPEPRIHATLRQAQDGARNTQHATRRSLTALALIVLTASATLATPFGAGFADWRGVAAALETRVGVNDVVVQNYPDPAFAYYYDAPARRTVLPAEVPISRLQTDRSLRALLDEHAHLWLLPKADVTWDAAGLVRAWLDRRAELVTDEWVAGHRLLAYRAAPEARPDIPNPLGWRVGDLARLAGYRLSGTAVASGESVELTLFWEPIGATDIAYTVFVHLWDGQTIWGQRDGEPQAGAWPTTHWFPGDLIEDTREIRVDPETPAGEYQLIAGLYRLETGERLPVFDTECLQRGDYVSVADVHIEP